MILIPLLSNLLAAGSNYAHRLGLNDGSWNLTTFTAQNGPEFEAVYPGDHHTLAISNGVVYCWGHNNRGKCGVDQSQGQVNSPQVVENLKNYKAIRVAAGQDHSMVLTDDGQVYTFGKNTSGQLGAEGPSGNELKHPVFDEKIIDVAASQSLSLAVTESGKVYAFGYCSYYRCGEELNGQMLNRPTLIKLGFSVSRIFLTVHGAYFAAQDGRTYVMGYNYFGELCYPDNQEGISSPVQITTVNNLVKVTSGITHAILLTAESQAYGCGSHGHAVFGKYGVEAKEPYFLGNSIADAAAVEAGTLLIVNGKLMMTGFSGYGEMNFQGQCYAFEEAGIIGKSISCYSDACFLGQ